MLGDLKGDIQQAPAIEEAVNGHHAVHGFFISATGSGGVGPLHGAVLDDNDDEQYNEQDEEDRFEINGGAAAAGLERVNA